jgi:hypothetical protein
MAKACYEDPAYQEAGSLHCRPRSATCSSLKEILHSHELGLIAEEKGEASAQVNRDGPSAIRTCRLNTNGRKS